MIDAESKFGPQEPERFSRRELFKRAGKTAIAAGAVAALGPSIIHPQEVNAEALDGGPDISPLLLATPEGQEYEFPRRITTTRVTFDPELSKRAITPIDAVVLSENTALFENLTPNNPQDRLDLFSLWMLAGMYKYRNDFKDLQREPFTSQDEMASTPTGQRALAGGILPEVTLEDMIVYNDKLADPEFKNFGAWVYDEGEVSGLNFKRKKINKDRVRINFTNKPSAFTWLYDTVSAGNPPYAGFTQTVDEHGNFTLNIYSKDQPFQSNVQTPAQFFDTGFSSGIAAAGEFMILYGGRYDLFKGFDASVYWPERNPDNGFYLYSTPAELIGGPKDSKYNRYITAPVIQIISPNIPR